MRNERRYRLKNLREQALRGGFSVTKDLADSLRTGFYVSYDGGREIPAQVFSPDHIHEASKDIGDDYIGTWLDNGTVYLDRTKRFEMEHEAQKFGMLQNQQAIYDATHDKVIPVNGNGWQEKTAILWPKWQWARKPQPQLMYHVAPRSARESILANGLRLPEGGTQGVWAFPQLEDAQSMMGQSFGGSRGDNDLWEVQHDAWEPDPHSGWTDINGSSGRSVMTRQPIPPNRLRLLTNERMSKVGMAWDDEPTDPNLMYHTAPQSERANILQHGLRHPEGDAIYAWDSLKNAQRWQGMSHINEDGLPGDIWEIRGHNDWEPDDYFTGGYGALDWHAGDDDPSFNEDAHPGAYRTYAVPPEKVRLLSEGRKPEPPEPGYAPGFEPPGGEFATAKVADLPSEAPVSPSNATPPPTLSHTIGWEERPLESLTTPLSKDCANCGGDWVEKTAGIRKIYNKFATKASAARYRRKVGIHGPVKPHKRKKIGAVTPEWWDDYIQNNPYSYHVHVGNATNEILNSGILPHAQVDPLYRENGYGGIENYPRPNHAYASDERNMYSPKDSENYTTFKIDNSQLDPDKIDFDEDYADQYFDYDRENWKHAGGRGGFCDANSQELTTKPSKPYLTGTRFYNNIPGYDPEMMMVTSDPGDIISYAPVGPDGGYEELKQKTIPYEDFTNYVKRGIFTHPGGLLPDEWYRMVAPQPQVIEGVDHPTNVQSQINKSGTFAIRGGIPAHALSVHAEGAGECEEYEPVHSDPEMFDIENQHELMKYWQQLSEDPSEFEGSEEPTEYNEKECIEYYASGAVPYVQIDAIGDDLIDNPPHLDQMRMVAKALFSAITHEYSHSGQMMHASADLKRLEQILTHPSVENDDLKKLAEYLQSLRGNAATNYMPSATEYGYGGYDHGKQNKMLDNALAPQEEQLQWRDIHDPNDPDLPYMQELPSNHPSQFKQHEEGDLAAKGQFLKDMQHPSKELKVGDRVAWSGAQNWQNKPGTVVEINHPQGEVRIRFDDDPDGEIWVGDNYVNKLKKIVQSKTANAIDDFMGLPGWKDVPQHVYNWLDENKPGEVHGLESDCINPKCFVPSTLVRTARGYIPISGVQVGDWTLAEGGHFEQVTQIFERHFAGELVEIDTHTTGTLVLATPEHPMRILRGQHHIKEYCEPFLCRRSNVEHSPDWEMAQDLTDHSFIMTEWPLEHTFGAETITVPEKYQVNQYGPRRIRLPEIVINDEFLWIIGLYLAEGSIGTRSITFSLHEDEVEYRDRVLAFFRKLGLTTAIDSRPSKCVVVRINSATLRDWWADWIGTHCTNKCIPEILMHLPSERLRPLLQGIMDGDGWKAGDRLAQASEMLALQVCELSMRLGGVPTLSTWEPKPDPRGWNGSTRYSVEGVTLERTKSKPGTWWHDDHLYSKVKSVRRVAYDGPVYNLEVTGNRTYVVQNLVVHNCEHNWNEDEQRELAQYGEIKCPTCDFMQTAEGQAGTYAESLNAPKQGPGGKTKSGLTMTQMGNIGEQLVARIGTLPCGHVIHTFAQYQWPVDMLTIDQHGNEWGVEVKTKDSTAKQRFALGDSAERAKKILYCSQNGLRQALVGVRLNFYSDVADIYFRPQFSDTWISQDGMQHVGTVNFADLNPFRAPDGSHNVPDPVLLQSMPF